jgi:RNA polymerase sigma-70 factor (ECF subfamily)
MNLLAAMSATVKPLPDAEDRALAARLARADPAAFDELVEQYGPRVLGLAARLLGWTGGAEDIAQEVFLQLLAKPRQFRGESSLWTYLARLTVNRCRSQQRKNWVHARVRRLLGVQTTAAGQESPAAIEEHETAQSVRAAVARLPSSYREVIVLRYFEEMAIGEIAEMLQTSRNAVDARLSRGRKLLETWLCELVE